MVRKIIKKRARTPADDLADFARRKSPKGKRYATKVQIEEAVADAARRVEEEDWSAVKPQVLVATFWWCHEKTYEEPPPLKGKAWNMACIAAGTMLKSQFGGDADSMLAFIRWTWQRERRFEQFRRQNQTHGKVLTVHDQFKQGKLLTEYRIDLKRQAGTA